MAADDFYAAPFGAIYSAYMERPRLSSRISRLVWGGDIRPYYASMAAAGQVSEGGTVVDCPCGAGPALRAIPGDRSIRYVGVDLSPSMIGRARRRAEARDLADVELIEASATEIPLPAASAELFLSYWGLHCFDDPAAALVEAARVLEPGGRLVGASFVRGTDTLRQRLLIRPHRGDFGPLGTEPEIESWFAAAGLDLRSTSRSGPLLYFDAHRSA
jgi:ubiquinone/menaquinone biosynthesis C-methylase UbiE